jgi:hypothetical protein
MNKKTAVPFLAVSLLFILLAGFGTAFAADFVWPVEGKTLRPFESDAHRGIDIEAAEGTAVKAAVSGMVTYVGYIEGSSSNLYHTISVRYGDEGLNTTYLQVRPSVEVGQSVEQGQEIGQIVRSADDDTTVSHLHFGVFQKTEGGSKVYQDPLTFLPEAVSEPVQESAQESSTVSQPVSDNAAPQPALTEQIPQISNSTARSPEPPPIVQPPPQAEPMNLSGTISVTPSQSQGFAATVSPNTISAVAATEESSQPSPTASLPNQGKVLATQVVQPAEAVVASSPAAEPIPTLSPAPVSKAGAALDPPTPANGDTLAALKDKQIEALSLAPANPHGSLGQDNAEYRAQPMRRFESQQSTIATSPDSVVITKFFLYLLLIVGPLVSTRAYSLRPGTTARA